MNPELMTAVRERLALGQSEEMIKEELKQAGYDESVTEQIIREARVTPIQSPADTSTVTLPGVGALLSVGWAFAKRYVGVAVLLSLPMVGLSALTYFLGEGQQDVAAGQTFVLIFASIVLYVIYFLLLASALRIAMIDDEPRAVSLQEAWSWAKGNAAGLLWVIILGGLVVSGGLMLFLIPGIIVSIYVHFSQYVYAAEGVRGMNALLRSRELVQGYWVALAKRLILISLVFMAVLTALGGVLGAIVALVGMGVWENSAWELVTNLIDQVINAFATLIGLRVGVELYRTLVRVRPVGATVLTEARGKYIALAWFGLFAPITVIVLLSSLFVSPLGLLGAEFQDAAIEQEVSDQDAKLRALEMRNEQGLGGAGEERDLEEF